MTESASAHPQETEPHSLYRLGSDNFSRRQVGDNSFSDEQHFWRRLAWSPDGTHLLAQSDDHHLDLFLLEERSERELGLRFCFSVRAPSTLLDFAWYPYARHDDEQTWCFVLGAKDVTVRLIDAYAGQTRATYGIQDHTERFVGVQALCFSLDGTRLICGHDNSITVFDLSRPGVNTHLYRMRLSPSKRAVRQAKAAAGQRGIISTMAVSVNRVMGMEQEMIAVGTFCGNVALYTMNVAVETGEQACIAGWKEDKSRGISQLFFHPTSPYILFLNSRRTDEIRAYDLRYVGPRRSFLHAAPDIALLGRFKYSESREEGIVTQQRLFFDIDREGKKLHAGTRSGRVITWSVDVGASLTAEEGTASHAFGQIVRDGHKAQREHVHQWQAAKDTIPSVAIHPTGRICAIASGSRRWQRPDEGPYGVNDGALALFDLSA